MKITGNRLRMKRAVKSNAFRKKIKSVATIQPNTENKDEEKQYKRRENYAYVT